MVANESGKSKKRPECARREGRLAADPEFGSRVRIIEEVEKVDA